MVSLGQKLKMLKRKNMQKTIYKNIRVVLCKKTLVEKTPNIRENETILKIGHLAKAIAHKTAKACKKTIYSLCKMFSLGQKLKKTIEQENYRVVL